MLSTPHPGLRLASRLGAGLLSVSIAAGAAPVSGAGSPDQTLAPLPAQAAVADGRAAREGRSPARTEWIRSHYTKHEVRIPMRDGVHLFTSVYVPNDASPGKRYPILLNRTPYSVAPYGAGRYKDRLGPFEEYEREGFIFVFQDVRGCFLSEGSFVNMRPHNPEKRGPRDIDESSDTYDTIEWLLGHLTSIAPHNGRVGMWGNSPAA